MPLKALHHVTRYFTQPRPAAAVAFGVQFVVRRTPKTFGITNLAFVSCSLHFHSWSASIVDTRLDVARVMKHWGSVRCGFIKTTAVKAYVTQDMLDDAATSFLATS
jgi:hypothetical protein